MAEVEGAVEAVLARIRRAATEMDEDVTVMIDGKEGSGKSTLALRFAIELEEDWHANLTDRCFYSPSRYIHHSETAGAGAVLVADEGMEFVYRREGMTRPVRRFNKYMSKARYRNQYHILCIPDRSKADDDYASWRVQFRCEAIKRPKGWANFYVGGGRGHWKKLFRFPYAPLEGTQLWEDYLVWKDEKLGRESSQRASPTVSKLGSAVKIADEHERDWERLVSVAARTEGSDG